jgi:hypothetical protein
MSYWFYWTQIHGLALGVTFTYELHYPKGIFSNKKRKLGFTQGEAFEK